MKLIVTRHGETEENKSGILQGHLPGKLTDLGMDQARKLALRFKNEKIDAIYSSDLARASDTAKEIAKYHPDIPLYFVEELREKNQGSITGKLIKDVDWSKSRDTEKKEKMVERAKKILDEAYKKYKEKTVIFVSHGGLITVLISLITNKSFDDVKKMGNPSNTSVSIFEIKENTNHEIIILNCDKHLHH
ncbi:MAG: histidine phosphatase family protein [archaeon]|nr:histidine phosphatase family protein [archaeon]